MCLLSASLAFIAGIAFCQDAETRVSEIRDDNIPGFKLLVFFCINYGQEVAYFW